MYGPPPPHLDPINLTVSNWTGDDSSGPPSDDDDVSHFSVLKAAAVVALGTMTATSSSYCAWVGFPGIMFTTRYPLHCPRERCVILGCCGFVWPCNWSPLKLFAANFLGVLSSACFAILSLLAWLKFRIDFFIVVGVMVNGISCLLCSVASFLLYQPQYRIRKVMQFFESEYFDGPDL